MQYDVYTADGTACRMQAVMDGAMRATCMINNMLSCYAESEMIVVRCVRLSVITQAGCARHAVDQWAAHMHSYTVVYWLAVHSQYTPRH